MTVLRRAAQSHQGNRGPTLCHALDRAFGRRLEVQGLRREPLDQRGQLRISKSLPPGLIDLALDRPAGHTRALRGCPPWGFGYFRALIVRTDSATGYPNAEHRDEERYAIRGNARVDQRPVTSLGRSDLFLHPHPPARCGSWFPPTSRRAAVWPAAARTLPRS